MNIVKKLEIIIQKVNKNARAYLVGGAVRDMIANIPPKDHDFVVTGVTKEDLIAAGGTFVDPKSAFPVFLFDIDGEQCEVAIARTEKKVGTGHRAFELTFGPEVTIEEDLFRRDFTINAIAMNSNGEFVDPYGGVNDIKNRILRIVNPKAFIEDPLRVIRLCRFAAYGYEPSKETLEIARQIPETEFEALPIERFVNEFLKAAKKEHFSKFIITLLAIPNAMKVYFPELKKMATTVAGPVKYHGYDSVLDHTIKVINAQHDPIARIAALFHDIGKIETPEDILPHHYGHDKTNIYENIKFYNKLPNNYKKAIQDVVHEHMRVKKVKLSKLIRIFEMTNRNGTTEVLISIAVADGYCNEEKLRTVAKVAAMKAKELGIVDKIRGKKSDIIKQIILDAKIKKAKEMLNE